MNKSVVTAGDFRFFVTHTNSTELMRANSFLSKEPETVRWIQDTVAPGCVFWDVGANIGLFSIYAAVVEPSCRVLAFEPAAHNYASLCENLMVNGLVNVKPHCIAVGGGGVSFPELHLSKMEAGSAIHNLGGRSPWSTADPVFVQPCVAASVDTLVRDFGFPAPTMLKIDVDGIELEILAGARSALEKVGTLLVELDANDPVEVGHAEQLLKACGFSLAECSPRQKTINGKLPRNYIWKR